ncbi:uncharacterized protein LOC119080794 [Bradysia coprophila]|uniref:uncharacterized protein LOC119080794 n=1 Tax=Bradysia coprophila TaxID=38358 RepID=UPI00187D6FA7|nr:uncharacterized protein LOC119080794 [Bradysia coprophila]
MWQILTITLISINFVAGHTNCPGFSNYKHDPTLSSHLNGEYLVVYTTSSYVLDCERISWTVGPGNNRTAYLKDADGCCRRIDNFDSSNPDYIEHDISPLSTSTCSNLPSTERVSEKLIRSTASGTNLCLFVYICHLSRHGLLVSCREKPEGLPLLLMIGEIVMELLNLLLPIQVLKTVNHSNCIFTNNCFF